MVSWNEAAEMKDSVASEALVMPSKMRSIDCRFTAIPLTFSVGFKDTHQIKLLTAQQSRITGRA